MKRLITLVTLVLVVPTPALAGTEPSGPLTAMPRAADNDPGWRAYGPIVFVRTGDGDSNLWSVLADGSKLRRLTSSRKADTEPAWSPRGATIVFTRSGHGRSDLYTLSHKGGRPELLLEDGSAPAFSPIGGTIAFVRTVDGNTDLYTADADGTDVVRITTDPGVDTDPAWGPGGTRLTFASDRDGDFDIYSADPDGADVRPLTDDVIDQRNPWDLWTWRDIGYDQGPDGDPTWCWQTIGVPSVVPGTPTSCANDGVHSYSVGTWGPFARLEPAPNGTSHLWGWAGDDLQLTFGRKTDSDPAVRPAGRAVVRALTRAAGDIDLGLTGAQAWVAANGSGAGADAGPSGLTTEAPTLCLVDADERSSSIATTCDAGAGTGSTSVYADADVIALARDTGLGLCLWNAYRRSGSDWLALFGVTDRGRDCTGTDARSAISLSW